MTEVEKIQDKLRKLVALRDSANKIGSLAEAETLAQKIQELCLKYNLEASQLGLKEPEQFVKNLKEFEVDKREGDWMEFLWGAIAKYNFCQVIGVSKTKKFYLIGKPVNVEIVEYTTLQMRNRIQDIEKACWKEYSGVEKRGAYRRGFYRGAALGIADKLRENNTKLQTETPQYVGLMKVEGQALMEFVAQSFGKLGYSKSSRLSGSNGREQGYEKGSQMGINRGVGAGSNSSRLLN